MPNPGSTAGRSVGFIGISLWTRSCVGRARACGYGLLLRIVATLHGTLGGDSRGMQFVLIVMLSGLPMLAGRRFVIGGSPLVLRACRIESF